VVLFFVKRRGIDLNNHLIWGAWLWVCGYSIAIWFPEYRFPIYVYLILAVIAAAFWYFKLPARGLLNFLILLSLAFGYYQWFDARNVTGIQVPGYGKEQIAALLENAAIKVEGRITSTVVVDGDHVGFILKTTNVILDVPNQEGSISDGRLTEDLQVSIRLLQQTEQEAALTWQRGDEVQLSGMLQLPSVARNFGGFDYRQYLRNQHIHWMLTLKGLDSVSIDSRFHWDFLQLLQYNDHFRSFLAEKLDVLFPENQAGYMKSLLIGLRVDLDPQQFQQFSNLGLTHILAISGMQVAVFCAVVLWILRKLRLTKETGLLITIAILPLYILFTGSSPSVIRAGLMAMIALYAIRRNWLKDGLKLLCLVGWLMLIWNPYSLLDVSFQLSFAVTYGLIVGVPWVSQLLPRQKVINSTLAVTIVAQLVSFPLTVYYFNQFSLISWLANIIMVPFISFVVTPIGSIALLLSLVSIRIAAGLAWLAIQCNQFTFWITAQMDSWSGFHTIWSTPSLMWIAAYFILLATVIWCLVRWKTIKLAQRDGVYISFIQQSKAIVLPVLINAVSFILLLGYGYSPGIWQEQGMVQFIDVGQGDSILIRTPHNKFILVDGGGTLVFRKSGDEWKQRKNPYEVGKNLLVPLLKKRGVHHLDYLIATHEDADHVGGLQAVLEQIPVRNFMFNGTLKPNTGVEKLFQTAIHLQIPLTAVNESTLLAIDDTTKLRFLYPFLDEPAFEGLPVAPAFNGLTVEKNQNNHSIVFIMEMYDSRFLFTGDMEKSAENKLLEHLSTSNTNEKKPPIIDVLKVAHHGSKTSTTEQWLEYWRPKNAVISVGEHNTYGHPTEEVLNRIQEHGIQLFRTDQQGEVDMIVQQNGIDLLAKFPVE
jgi:competence protein ComEC